MTGAIALPGSIPPPQRHGMPGVTPEAKAPSAEFAALLDSHGILEGSAEARATSDAAPAATAFDQGTLFGTAVMAPARAQADAPSAGMDAATVLSARLATSGAGASRATRPQAPAQEAVTELFGDATDLPSKRADDGDTGQTLGADAHSSEAETHSLLRDCSEASNLLTVPQNPTATPAALRVKMAADPTLSLRPRTGGASLRAAMIDRLGPVYLSLQSAGAESHIIARVAGVDDDEKEALARSLRKAAKAAGTDVGSLFLNGAPHAFVKRS